MYIYTYVYIYMRIYIYVTTNGVSFTLYLWDYGVNDVSIVLLLMLLRSYAIVNIVDFKPYG